MLQFSHAIQDWQNTAGKSRSGFWLAVFLKDVLNENCLPFLYRLRAVHLIYLRNCILVKVSGGGHYDTKQTT